MHHWYRYKPGDYTLVHSDDKQGPTGSRRLAFVLHMTKDWRPEWGGDLVFLSPFAATHPPGPHMAHSHTVHLALGALRTPYAMVWY